MSFSENNKTPSTSEKKKWKFTDSKIGQAINTKHREWVRTEHKVPLIICSVIFSLYAISLIYPLLWILVKSFMDPIQFKFSPDTFFPNPIYFGNYTEMIKEFDFVPMITNTLILGLVTPTIQIAAMCCISYAYAKFKFKGREIVYFIALSSMFIPTVGTLGAMYELMIALGMMDELWGYMILCGNGMGFGFLLVSSQFVNVSNEYSEAAQIDGASKLRTFIQIITPQIIPTLITLWLLSFISVWNDYAMPFLFLPSHKTLAIGIRELQYIARQSGGTENPIMFAGIIMVEVPVLILFFAFQKKILNISLGGGIKG